MRDKEIELIEKFDTLTEALREIEKILYDLERQVIQIGMKVGI